MAPNTAFDLQQSLEDKIPTENNNNDVQVSFSHVHFYVDHVEDVDVYKQLEDKLNNGGDVTENDTTFVPQNRDVVKQLLAGFGFRVTGARVDSDMSNTKSVLVTSKDPQGVQFVVSALDPDSSVEQDDVRHFDASKWGA